jgi:hypothetical protein
MIDILKQQNLKKADLLITLFLFPMLILILFILSKPRMTFIQVELSTLHPLNVFFLTGFLFPYSIICAVIAWAAGRRVKKLSVITVLVVYWIYSHALFFLWMFGTMYLGWYWMNPGFT